MKGKKAMEYLLSNMDPATGVICGWMISILQNHEKSDYFFMVLIIFYKPPLPYLGKRPTLSPATRPSVIGTQCGIFKQRSESSGNIISEMRSSLKFSTH